MLMFEKNKIINSGEKEEFTIVLSKSLEENTVQVQSTASQNRNNDHHDNSKENLQKVFDTLSRTLPKLFVQVNNFI